MHFVDTAPVVLDVLKQNDGATMAVVGEATGLTMYQVKHTLGRAADFGMVECTGRLKLRSGPLWFQLTEQCRATWPDFHMPIITALRAHPIGPESDWSQRRNTVAALLATPAISAVLGGLPEYKQKAILRGGSSDDSERLAQASARHKAVPQQQVTRLLMHDDGYFRRMVRSEGVDVAWPISLCRLALALDYGKSLRPQIIATLSQQRANGTWHGSWPDFEAWLASVPEVFLLWLTCKTRGMLLRSGADLRTIAATELLTNLQCSIAEAAKRYKQDARAGLPIAVPQELLQKEATLSLTAQQKLAAAAHAMVQEAIAKL